MPALLTENFPQQFLSTEMAIITVVIVTTVMRIILTTPPIIAASSSSSVAELNSVVVVRMHRMILYKWKNHFFKMKG